MAGRPRVVATGERRALLRALAGSRAREAADRARVILPPRKGWSSVRNAEAFSVEPDGVRHGRWTFGGEIGARAARPWLTVEWLPTDASEANAIEHACRHLKRHFPVRQTVRDPDVLDQAIHPAVTNRNPARQSKICPNLPIAAEQRLIASAGEVIRRVGMTDAGDNRSLVEGEVIRSLWRGVRAIRREGLPLCVRDHILW